MISEEILELWGCKILSLRRACWFLLLPHKPYKLQLKGQKWICWWLCDLHIKLWCLLLRSSFKTCYNKSTLLIRVTEVFCMQYSLCMMSVLSYVEWSDSRCASFAAAQYVSTYHQTAWHGTWRWIPHCLPWGLFLSTYYSSLHIREIG